jgi:hypothetical protein
VKKLGYEYPEDDSVDTVQLRTLAIEHAAGAGVKRYIVDYYLVSWHASNFCDTALLKNSDVDFLNTRIQAMNQ